MADMNQLARSVVAQATGQEPKRRKDPAAIARGRAGGLKRAANTAPEIRAADARAAAKARWSRNTARSA
jgi:hypothetical protein